MNELIDPSETSEEVDYAIKSITTDENNIFLPSGRALSIKEIYEITSTEKSKFIVLLGAVGSGKTAIISSIYNSFLNSPINNDYYFAGSKTLFDFEDRAFNTRTISNRLSPKHNRTYKNTYDILHIRIKDVLNNKFTNMLFADFSGEEYESAIGNIDYVRAEFPIIESASSIVTLIDGEKLSKPRTRGAEIQNSIQLLRTFVDSGLIRYNVPIILVVSKYDLVFNANVENWKETILSQFTQQLPMLQERIVIQEVAPLSEINDKICEGYGISKLFKTFLQKEIPLRRRHDLPSTNSQFEIWGRRLLDES